MILHIIAALIAALLALTGVSAEDETLRRGEVVTESATPELNDDQISELNDDQKSELNDDQNSTLPPSELPGPSS